MRHFYIYRTILVFILWSFARLSHGQVVENLNANLSQGKIVVTYDLTGGTEKQRYNIQLFSSHNDFEKPLQKVTGDVGKNIKGGKGRKIVWDITGEAPDHYGVVNFRVEYEIVPVPLVMKKPVTGSSMRRGRNTVIEWEGGLPGEAVQFELCIGDVALARFGAAKNTGRYDWSVPKSMDKGTYTLKMKIGEERASSGPIKIKPAVPLVVKIAPIVLAGAAAAAYIFWPKEPAPDGEVSDDLAAPPGPK